MSTKEIMPALINELENANFGFFAEEFCVPINVIRENYFYLCEQLGKLNCLLKLYPDRQEKFLSDFAEVKKKIMQEMLTKSLLLPGNDSNLFSLSGNPFPAQQKQN